MLALLKIVAVTTFTASAAAGKVYDVNDQAGASSVTGAIPTDPTIGPASAGQHYVLQPDIV